MVYNIFGFKVYKESDCSFGYDKSADGFVVNEIEKEIIQYLYETAYDSSNAPEDMPERLVEYLKQKNEEYEKIKKNVNISKVQAGRLKIEKLEPIIEPELWDEIQLKRNNGQQM